MWPSRATIAARTACNSTWLSVRHSLARNDACRASQISGGLVETCQSAAEMDARGRFGAETPRLDRPRGRATGNGRRLIDELARDAHS
jgi:hypothetical protein